MSAASVPGPASPAPGTATTAVLLVNLGTPDAPTPRAVRRYLGEFLLDPRVVQLPRWLWEPLLRLVILPLRAPRVARKYAAIWQPGGSPLAVYTQRLAEAVQERLPGLRVGHAMRYGAPALAATLQGLRRDGVARVLVLPLYPQYSTTTSASVNDVVLHAPGPEARVVADYHLDPDWIEAIAASVEAHWAAHGRGERLLFSFHGIPQRLVDGGDPYAAQCRASVEAVARRLGLDADAHLLTYQSRFGREPWLLPATSGTLQALARQGVRDVDVVCPGFAVDCLETLEEIAEQDAAAFVAAGGGRLRYIPCLNATPAHAQALAGVVQQELAQWP